MKKFYSLRSKAQYTVWAVFYLTVFESWLISFVAIETAVDRIKTPLLWTEVALVIVTYFMSLPACYGVNTCKGNVLVTYLVFLALKITVPVIVIVASGSDYWSSFRLYVVALHFVVLLAYFYAVIWCVIYRYYRQMVKVFSFLKKHTDV
jgi:hypothetical protein